MKNNPLMLPVMLVAMLAATFYLNVLFAKKHVSLPKTDTYWIYGKNGAMDIL